MCWTINNFGGEYISDNNGAFRVTLLAQRVSRPGFAGYSNSNLHYRNSTHFFFFFFCFELFVTSPPWVIFLWRTLFSHPSSLIFVSSVVIDVIWAYFAAEYQCADEFVIVERIKVVPTSSIAHYTIIM